MPSSEELLQRLLLMDIYELHEYIEEQRDERDLDHPDLEDASRVELLDYIAENFQPGLKSQLHSASLPDVFPRN